MAPLLDPRVELTSLRRVARSVHGLLNFMNTFTTGHCLKLHCRAFSNLSAISERPPLGATAELHRFVTETVQQMEPKRWKCTQLEKPWVIFTDGAFEDGVATIGAVVFPPRGQPVVHGGRVPDELVRKWQSEGGEQVIAQVELFAAVCVRHMYSASFFQRQTLWFIDNESARFCLIKGTSTSLSMLLLCSAFYSADLTNPTAAWIERVPSESNLADLPSRGLLKRAAEMVNGSVGQDLWADEFLLEPQCPIPKSLLRKCSD